MSSEKPTIFYVYDALCGWCYGFSPVISEFYQKHKEDFDFQVLSGGLVTGNGVGPVGAVASVIKNAYKDVEERTGVKFGENFFEEILEPGTAIFNSVPPALALALFRNQLPGRQIEFATRLQKAIYYDGLPPDEWTTYGTCAQDFGLNADEFSEKMQHPKLLELIHEEFNVVAHWGIRGFPAIVLKQGQQAYMLTQGYTPLRDLEENFAQTLGKLEN